MKRNVFAFFVLFLVVNSSAFASVLYPEDSFVRINNCVQKEDYHGCANLLTASSSSLYKRFISYGLIGCMPKDAQYVSQQRTNIGVIVRASVTDKGKIRFMRLMFVKEKGKWKIDVPESLRMAMGKNWQKELELIEDIYLVMRGQFGAKLDCSTIRNLVR